MPSIHNDCLFFSHLFWVSLVTQTVKNLTTMRETWIRSLGQGNGNPFLPGEFHGQRRREWQPIPVFLPGEFHGQRSLAGYSPWGCKESDMTEQLSTARRPQMIHKDRSHSKPRHVNVSGTCRDVRSELQQGVVCGGWCVCVCVCVCV